MSKPNFENVDVNDVISVSEFDVLKSRYGKCLMIVTFYIKSNLTLYRIVVIYEPQIVLIMRFMFFTLNNTIDVVHVKERTS